MIKKPRHTPMDIEPWKNVWEFLGNIWSILGPSVLFIIVLSLIIELISEKVERKAISSDVEDIVSTVFATNLRLEKVPKIVVKWGKEDKAILDSKKGRLVIVLRRGRERHENVAMALLVATPVLLSPEMNNVYDLKFLVILSAHIVSSFMKERHDIVGYINNISSEMEKGSKFNELSAMLIKIDKESLFSRLLLPELIRAAKQCHPHRDPEINKEALELIRILYNYSMVKGEHAPDFKSVMCGKYFKLLIIRVARPEMTDAMLESYIQFVEQATKKCPGILLFISSDKRARAAAEILEDKLDKLRLIDKRQGVQL